MQQVAKLGGRRAPYFRSIDEAVQQYAPAVHLLNEYGLAIDDFLRLDS